MKQNEGIVDRIIRLILAMALFYGAMVWTMSDWLRIVMAVVGGIILVTSITGFCGIYKIFNISTTKKRESFENDKNHPDDSSDTQEPLFKGHK